MHAANDWGLYDMGGNVNELRRDEYATYAFDGTIPVLDPLNTVGEKTVGRGGGYQNDATFTRSTRRTSWAKDTTDWGVGVRFVCPAPGSCFPNVFHPEWKPYCREVVARSIAPHRFDPWVRVDQA